MLLIAFIKGIDTLLIITIDHVDTLLLSILSLQIVTWYSIKYM